MGRNHFSRAGGPYFINDGFTRHADKDFTKPDKSIFYVVLVGFGILLATVGSFLYSL